MLLEKKITGLGLDFVDCDEWVTRKCEKYVKVKVKLYRSIGERYEIKKRKMNHWWMIWIIQIHLEIRS